ncbi:MAG: response regulator [Proteobacteria bacterium]|nr:MAG: response regulator [Pseudomonadota bacterium]
MTNQQACLYAVDDDEDDQLILRIALKGHPEYELVCFSSGEALLARLATLASRQLPQLILLDLDMPGMHGYQVLETLKARPAWQSIPVLILSGTPPDQMAEKAYSLGASAFISKPNTFSQLQDWLAPTCAFWLPSPDSSLIP